LDKQRRLVTTDPAAIAYILANNQKYYKPESARWHLSYILGNGEYLIQGTVRIEFGIDNPRGLVTAEGVSISGIIYLSYMD
jgi:hypothetical protein